MCSRSLNRRQFRRPFLIYYFGSYYYCKQHIPLQVEKIHYLQLLTFEFNQFAAQSLSFQTSFKLSFSDIQEGAPFLWRNQQESK